MASYKGFRAESKIWATNMTDTMKTKKANPVSELTDWLLMKRDAS
ncbi:hypothetical protein SCT_0908 [Sulfuricella sp. T08]|nr:hypothetical protein SCT_0908 [Sulfuricella sp. T08]